jgi:hypothetical protein
VFEADAARQRPFTVVMTGGRSTDVETDDLGPVFDWQAALIAAATAIFERGGTIVVLANTEFAHMVAAIAAPYSEPHGAEQRRVSARVHVVETGGYSEIARDELAPFAHRNAITYRDAEHRIVDELPGIEAVPLLSPEALLRREHHPITQRLMDEFQPIGVIVVTNTQELGPDLERLHSMDPPHVALLAPRGRLNEWERSHDPTRSILRDMGDDDDSGQSRTTS